MKYPNCPQCHEAAVENIGCTFFNKVNTDEIFRKFTVSCAVCGCVFEISDTFRIVKGSQKVEVVGNGDPGYALRRAMQMLDFGEDEEDD